MMKNFFAALTLSPSLVILSEAKNPFDSALRVNFAKNPFHSSLTVNSAKDLLWDKSITNQILRRPLADALL